MSLPVEGVGAWRASVERASPIRAADPMGSGAALSPWQALMATATLANAPDNTFRPEWHARVEPGPARPASPPVIDDPERVETAETKPAKPPAANAGPPGLFQDDDFSFADLIDVINPLQHIPIVSTIYRELTGDRIGHGARFAGGFLFMGPVGALTALANVVMIESSGKDAGEHALALFKDDAAPATALAANASPAGETKANANPAPIADERTLAELLPPGAIPIAGANVEFTQAALRPPALAALAPSSAQPSAVTDDDLPPPPPRTGPIAGPGWKGFYSPPETPSATPPVAPPESVPRPDRGALVDARGDSPAQPEPKQAHRALAPDPLAALAAKRTPGALAGVMPAPTPGSIGVEGGWFSDVMLDALAKYEYARQLRGPQGPEAARPGAVNIVN